VFMEGESAGGLAIEGIVVVTVEQNIAVGVAGCVIGATGGDSAAKLDLAGEGRYILLANVAFVRLGLRRRTILRIRRR
jgi:hypothetical protein